ncbi:hypothetical protein H2198_006247 [Neophaeococcomyces mojaviensis]|uniref:Uncharacterized protein n=1 Tax=Neophaeococcomyces mojaviensis TaxID=3383035 RepID=A0ACC3A3E9_9EURO|nr:hypothetical protein H2198_006247 [Knufia sp. JES_112]
MFEDKQTQDASERPSSRTSYQQERAIEIHLRMLNEDPNITPELVLRTADSIELIPSTNLSPTNRNSNHKKSTEDHGISDQTPSSSNEKPPCQLTVKSKLGGNLKVINSASPHRIVNACNVSPRPRKKEILASNKVDLDDFGDSATFYPKDGDYRVFPDSQFQNYQTRAYFKNDTNTDANNKNNNNNTTTNTNNNTTNNNTTNNTLDSNTTNNSRSRSQSRKRITLITYLPWYTDFTQILRSAEWSITFTTNTLNALHKKASSSGGASDRREE